MTAPLPAAYEVRAHNGAAASENKIHDDTVAQRFGFRGALVPGVAVFAYHGAPAGQALGPRVPGARRGGLPVSEAGVRRRHGAGDGGGRRRGPRAAGRERRRTLRHRARRDAATATQRPRSTSLPAGVPPAERPRASEESLGVGRALGIVPMVIDRAAHSAYLDEIRETEPLYRAEGLVHPGQILRLANYALLQNVVLGPWIHVGSTIRFHAAARVGEELTLRSRITSNAVNKGHADRRVRRARRSRDGARVVAEIGHSAIWRPRQVAEAAASEQHCSA